MLEELVATILHALDQAARTILSNPALFFLTTVYGIPLLALALSWSEIDP